MSLLVDLKYINLVGHLLRNFKKKKDYLWNYSCPVCGDSAKNKIKARGYIFRGDNSLVFKCHNCGCTGAFGNLIKTVDPDLFKQYVYEDFLEKRGDEATAKPKATKLPAKKKSQYIPVNPTALAGCPPISTLGPDHPARVYLTSRKIPEKLFKELFWTDDFPALVDKIDPNNKFELKKEGRIIIPFLDRSMRLMAIQGRTLNPKSKLRYITIKAFPDAPRVYGLHRQSLLPKRIYVLEGPFDSMFLPNALAAAGSDLPKGLDKNRTVVVFDNEPRNKAICDKMEAALNEGYRVCIWPNTIKSKDINLMILSEGYTPDKIRGIVDANSYTGIEGIFLLGRWRLDRKDDDSTPNKSRKDNEQTTPTNK